ncbi:ABC transporter ATP-binding protein [Gracilibacillus oryzae]|uniref:ABC transporter ATP-binding protein n=1 Tax=Gracilibacillus oryzae TaxID=1672701 RepID=A0A7C8GQZ8_9BACI|nr:dipeptide/oligopeptide/nickel ABC transporter ATP-binding protein [Gracilibacillus oryzae]KAB8126588.1 ABC transporter ATP-binding protein [Gracilibacillus oryzae]
MSLLELKNISKSYKTAKVMPWKKAKQINALQDVSLTLEPGICTGLIGKSGSGKSTLARVIMGLEKPDAGQVIFKGADLSELNANSLKKMRRHFQMVFQDPYSALNPRMTIGKSIAEPLENYEKWNTAQTEDKVKELLEEVNLKAADAYKYPGQFSGGQLQRINIARALALRPELLVLDEVVSSLDTIAQVQVLDLLIKLQQKFQLSYLFISHDMHATKYIANQFIVMDHGEIAEQLSDAANVEEMKHPVSKELLSPAQKESKIDGINERKSCDKRDKKR